MHIDSLVGASLVSEQTHDVSSESPEHVGEMFGAAAAHLADYVLAEHFEVECIQLDDSTLPAHNNYH